MLKLARRARGHFVTLIEIRVHLIRVKPGHISTGVDGHFGVQNNRKYLRRICVKVEFSPQGRGCLLF